MSHFEGKIALQSQPAISSIFTDQAGWREPHRSGKMLKCLLLPGDDISPRQKLLVCGARLGLIGSSLFTGHGTEDSSEAKDRYTDWTQHRRLQAAGWCCIPAGNSTPGLSSQHLVTAQTWSSGKKNGKSRVGGRINKFCDLSCFLTKPCEIETTFESSEMILGVLPIPFKETEMSEYLTLIQSRPLRQFRDVN